MLEDGNVELFAFLKEPSTVTFAIQDSQPMLALENDLTMKNETDSEDPEDSDVEEPPPCPVHLM